MSGHLLAPVVQLWQRGFERWPVRWPAKGVEMCLGPQWPLSHGVLGGVELRLGCVRSALSFLVCLPSFLPFYCPGSWVPIAAWHLLPTLGGTSGGSGVSLRLALRRLVPSTPGGQLAGGMVSVFSLRSLSTFTSWPQFCAS